MKLPSGIRGCEVENKEGGKDLRKYGERKMVQSSNGEPGKAVTFFSLLAFPLPSSLPSLEKENALEANCCPTRLRVKGESWED